jgi:hypothetical protein
MVKTPEIYEKHLIHFFLIASQNLISQDSIVKRLIEKASEKYSNKQYIEAKAYFLKP